MIHGCMEENVVKLTCAEFGLEFNVRKNENI